MLKPSKVVSHADVLRTLSHVPPREEGSRDEDLRARLRARERLQYAKQFIGGHMLQPTTQYNSILY